MYRALPHLDLSRFCSAPRARLGYFPLEGDRAFPAHCRVPSSRIVETIDVLEDGQFRFSSCLTRAAIAHSLGQRARVNRNGPEEVAYAARHQDLVHRAGQPLGRGRIEKALGEPFPADGVL